MVEIASPGEIMNNIRLVPLDKMYCEQLLKLWGNENVMKYTYLDTLSNVKDVEFRVDYWLTSFMDKAFVNNFVIMCEDEVIGVAGFPILKKNPFKCGIYYQLMEEYHGKGIGTYIVGLMKEMIFERFHMGEIVTRCTMKNHASKRVLEKNGFICVGIEKEGFERNGEKDDVVKYVFIKKL